MLTTPHPAAAVDGTWNAPAAGNWSTPANWLGGVPTQPGDTATFPLLPSAARNVTVDVPVTLDRLTFDIPPFNTATYVFSGTNTLTLGNINAPVSGAIFDAPVTFAPGARVAGSTSSNSPTLQFRGPLAASGTLTFWGDGLRQLRGDNAALTATLDVQRGLFHAYSSLPAVTAINVRDGAGFWVVSSTGDIVDRDRLSDTTPITLSGGTFGFDGQQTPGSTETVGPTTLARGRNAISVTYHTTTVPQPTLTLASLARNRFATLELGPRNFDQRTMPDPGERIFIRSAPTLANGILGGWATGYDHAAWNYDFVTYDLAVGIRTLGAAGRPSSLATAGPADNVLLTTAPQPLTADVTINSLVVRPATPDFWQVDLDGHTLNLVSGGLLLNSAQIRNGKLTAGGTSPGPAELFLRAGTAADIVDNPAGGAVSIVISGGFDVGLGGHNTYSGSTVVNGGFLTVSSDSTLPAATPMEINGGRLTLSASSTIPLGALALRARATVLHPTGATPSINAGAYAFESGQIQYIPLVGNGPMTKTGPDQMSILGTNPDYTGAVTVLDGDLLAGLWRADPGAPRALGTGPITIQGGRLLHYGGRIDNPITLAGGDLTTRGDGATLGRFEGPVTVSADSSITTQPETDIVLSGPLTLAADHTLTKSGPTPLRITGPVSASPGAALRATSGPLTLGGGGHTDLTLRAANDASVALDASTSLAALTLSDRATATLAAGRHVLAARSLSLAAATKLDLTDGALLLDYSGPSPLPQLRADLAANRLTSSLKSPTATLGYAEAAEILPFTNGTATFLGQSVDPTTLLVRLTLPGDANLDGTVNFDDLLALAKNYNATDQPWNHGDFDASGTVNFDDLLLLAKNYNSTLPAADIPGAPAPFSTDLATAFAAVPEPATPLLLALTACGLALSPRRRRLIDA